MRRRQTKGFSMIEILVTVIIISVGLLGIASLQIISLKNVNNTQFRTLATIYAYDMAERMRSNRAALGDYDGIDTDTVSETEPVCSPCTAAQITQYDAYEWKIFLSAAANSGGLPSGVGTVVLNSGVYDITVSWQEQGRDNSGGLIENKSFTLSVKI